ncbi:MAG TPA: GIY-YIG nuclease family protein [Ktedonosporobacter sp.]|jgi:hypothetical protein|nr:GIY-YIG nuclease family protein [Ktedonosporobacter sp.]
MPKFPNPLGANEKQYQIYALIDPRDKSIRYVGLSNDVRYRFAQHLLRDGGKLERAWIIELQQLGLSPIFQILETVADNTYPAACEREHHWIYKLTCSGHSLLNVSGVRRAYPQIKKRNQEEKRDKQSGIETYTVPSIGHPKNASSNISIEPPMRSKLVATEKYDFIKLLDNMPANQAELARQSGVNERTIIRMKNGDAILRGTANKILRGLSQIYGKTFTLDNVTGINISDR